METKVVLVGDHLVGKTSTLFSYVKKDIPTRVPKTFGRFENVLVCTNMPLLCFLIYAYIPTCTRAIITYIFACADT